MKILDNVRHVTSITQVQKSTNHVTNCYVTMRVKSTRQFRDCVVTQST